MLGLDFIFVICVLLLSDNITMSNSINLLKKFVMLDLFVKVYSSKEKARKPAKVFLDIKKRLIIDTMKNYGLSGAVYMICVKASLITGTNEQSGENVLVLSY